MNSPARDILFVSHYFPPAAGGGVQRTLKFIKHLPRENFRPVVLTSEGGSGFSEDRTLLEDIERTDVKVVRTASPYERAARSPSAGARALARALDRLSVPDRAALWAFKARKAGLRLIREEGVRLIYATGSPYSNFMLGAWLSRQARLPLVLDYRDPWTLSPFLDPTPAGRLKLAVERRMERAVLRGAAAIVLNVPSAKKRFDAAFPEHADKSLVITNGFDEDDFQNVEQYPFPEGTFTVLHAGSFLRYRRPDVFFEALRRLKERDALPEELRIVLAGKRDEAALEKAREMGLADRIHAPGYLSHTETVRCLKGADCLLLIMEPTREGESATVPGKLFEYLGARRPILAMTPDPSDARDILKEWPPARCAGLDDPEEIAGRLMEIYGDWKRNGGTVEADIDENLLKPYTRRHQAAQLAALFEGLL